MTFQYKDFAKSWTFLYGHIEDYFDDNDMYENVEDERPSYISVNKLREMISDNKLQHLGFPTFILPDNEGGMMLEWHTKNEITLYHILKDGECTNHILKYGKVV